MITDVNGEPLAPESSRMLEYLNTRATEMSTAGIRERIRAAAQELETAVAQVNLSDARRRPFEGKWHIAEVVDHISQTQIRGTEELRHLLEGRRPPLPPVYEALRSGAGTWAPWDLLKEELHAANQAMLDLLESAPEEAPTPSDPTVKTVMVTLRALNDGTLAPQIYFLEIQWKEYALLQRLHLLDHRTQVKKLRASLEASSSGTSVGSQTA
jgi:hypothetical protein